MARVVLPRALAVLADGATELVVEGDTVRAVLRALEARYPGIGEPIEQEMAVAVDGEILSDPWLEPVGRDTELHFVPRLQGG